MSSPTGHRLQLLFHKKSCSWKELCQIILPSTFKHNQFSDQYHENIVNIEIKISRNLVSPLWLLCSQFGTLPPLPGSLDYLHSNGHDGDGNGPDSDGNGHDGDGNGHDGDGKGQVTIMVISDCHDQSKGDGWWCLKHKAKQ